MSAFSPFSSPPRLAAACCICTLFETDAMPCGGGGAAPFLFPDMDPDDLLKQRAKLNPVDERVGEERATYTQSGLKLASPRHRELS